MKRLCPICQTPLNDNSFIKDSGATAHSYLELVVKDDDLKKTNYELKCGYCPKCGHVELFIDLDK